MSDTELTEDHARQLDIEDPLRHLRDEFLIPTRPDLKRKTIRKTDADSNSDSDSSPCIYFCGNSLGLPPRQAGTYIQNLLDTWATKGVYGHFKTYDDTKIPPWTRADEACFEPLARIVGARPSEVTVMQTLTANLHFLMASFFRPTKQRHKIILEGKAFPSDHYAVESQLHHHGLSPVESMVLIEPPDPSNPYLPTDHVIRTIEAHADSTALVLLPGIQFYTGQLLDIPAITAAARAAGVPHVGWDLAHAVGNVELALHDSGADFAVWCHYKYLNAGPGVIGGLFVHERHGGVAAGEGTDGENGSSSSRLQSEGGEGPRPPRLAGWWGVDVATRFEMTNRFEHRKGAAGWQVSNPSMLDMSSLVASLELFSRTDMAALRRKSVRLTNFLERLLHRAAKRISADTSAGPCFDIITPAAEKERGAQLSVRLKPGLLDFVLERLEDEGVVVDERKPDVVRVAPVPLYNTFEEVWRFVQIFERACRDAINVKANQDQA